MLAGCYTLHLYCEVRIDGRECGRFGEYHAETGAACRRQARDDGWRIGRYRGEGIASVACPEHSGKTVQPKPGAPSGGIATLAALMAKARKENR